MFWQEATLDTTSHSRQTERFNKDGTHQSR